MKRKLFFILFTIFFSFSLTVKAEDNKYGVIDLKGAVNPIIADYIEENIQQAEKDGCQFIILQLDTPGGLVTSMRQIVQAIMQSPIPVIVYTAPSGAQAASAGGFIMLSGHLAAMSPGTEIGAMHPVNALPFLSGSKDEKNQNSDQQIMEKKVLNDLLAYGRSLAQERQRNVNWTERAIKDAISSSANEALKLNVIDLIAIDTADLLKQCQGKRVKVLKKSIRLNTLNAVPIYYEMNTKQKFLNKIADPQIVFILFIIALVGIGFEIKSPGMIFPGVIGGSCLLLFLLATKIVPINFIGILLIILAIVLIILEFQIVSYGMLTVGGILSFVLGALILFDSPEAVLPGFRVPIVTVIIMIILLLAFVFLVVRVILKTFKTRVTTGKEGIVGEIGEVLNFDEKKKHGKAYFHGEIWAIYSTDFLEIGDTVEVLKLDKMKLHVIKINKKGDL